MSLVQTILFHLKNQVEKFTTHTFEETQKIGQDFACKILALGPQKTAVVLALQGNLGAGKTTFLQGFARGLGIDEVVNSPTFVIMRKFKLEDKHFTYFYHVDLYRLENEKDLEFLHFQEIISNPENIIAIEWPEKISSLLPKNTILIKFEHSAGNERILTIKK